MNTFIVHRYRRICIFDNRRFNRILFVLYDMPARRVKADAARIFYCINNILILNLHGLDVLQSINCFHLFQKC